jgi:membrane-bound lytic murein transglycosylase D
MQLRSALSVSVLSGLFLGSMLVTVLPAGTAGSGEAASTDLADVAAELAAARWDLPMVRNEYVQRKIDGFSRGRNAEMALYLKRSGRYEGMIRQKLAERGMPEDLVYLSLVESGFNANARSKAQAVGLWQFIAETGRRYGLRIDGYVDERRDPEKSTDAALRYLSDLHRQLGSWSLAAAAYNSGENRVKRIMREVTGSEQGDEHAYWRIRPRLPAETRDYVPLIYAAAIVGKEPEKYGLGGVPRWVPVAIDTVEVPGGVSLEVVAKAVGVSEKELRTLNPHLLRAMTPPGDGYPVLIPENRGPLFLANFDVAREEARVAAAAAAAAAARARAAAARPAQARPVRHTVRRGDTLSGIAKRHGTSVSAIQRVNGMGRRTNIQPGQVLRVR